ncbi:hypothetical protein HJP15_08050 [Pseudoalteromonas sp. NEC-BIFX-2020_002]|uniref:hypothetical protein n=1 Tax=Pseudoalteromonas sp. NEC-BIFX-2020_002 TaxID=2732353 RepID=UPI001476A384|nr:hypothetical protein [Pseudoalteromonas sp. NEC-BIFX-2020_002]NNG42862.1 hypothetical protein [Pseudoalteromonas sp. NEC-BIFX-2020_002]
MYKAIALIVGTFFVGGCTSVNDDQVASNDELHCEYRTKVGSSIKKKICMTTQQKKQDDLNNENAKQALRNTRNGSLGTEIN